MEYLKEDKGKGNPLEDGERKAIMTKIQQV